MNQRPVNGATPRSWSTHAEPRFHLVLWVSQKLWLLPETLAVPWGRKDERTLGHGWWRIRGEAVCGGVGGREKGCAVSFDLTRLESDQRGGKDGDPKRASPAFLSRAWRAWHRAPRRWVLCLCLRVSESLLWGTWYPVAGGRLAN